MTNLMLFLCISLLPTSLAFSEDFDDEATGNQNEIPKTGSYRVRYGKASSTAAIRLKFKKLYTKYIPLGCYGQKQLLDMIRKNYSTIDYKPVKPDWCNQLSGSLVPGNYSLKPPQKSIPPYQIIAIPLNKSDSFRVIIRATKEDQYLTEAVIIARGVNEVGIPDAANNRGRFITTKGVRLVCCSYYDKDVAWYKNEEAVKEVIFYWLPDESTEHDFEGSFLFQATVANTTSNYWVNITSAVYTVIDHDEEDGS